MSGQSCRVMETRSRRVVLRSLRKHKEILQMTAARNGWDLCRLLNPELPQIIDQVEELIPSRCARVTSRV